MWIKKFLFYFFLFGLSAFVYAQNDSISADSTIPERFVLDSAFVDTNPYNEVSIVGVGDIMLGTNFPSKIYLPPNADCFPLLEEVKDSLSNADITFGNLEGCFSDSAPLAKKCRDTTKCYAFRMPEQFVECLSESGFDLLSLANNHSGDFGEEGLQTTKSLLDTSGIGYAGLVTDETTFVEKDSVLYGFVAFSPNKGTLLIHDYNYAASIVKALNDTADIVIVSFHGGAEGAKYERVTRETEEFYGENRGNVYEFAHKMIDAGADVIFGHGPHVTRAVELYKDRFIIYSLGNFCTWGRFNLRGPNGIAPIIKIYTTTQGVFLRGNIIPTYQDGKKGTKIDDQKRIIFKLQLLTKQDFPDSQLQILDSGEIKRIN